jgi:hypothetical protein
VFVQSRRAQLEIARGEGCKVVVGMQVAGSGRICGRSLLGIVRRKIMRWGVDETNWEKRHK